MSIRFSTPTSSPATVSGVKRRTPDTFSERSSPISTVAESSIKRTCLIEPKSERASGAGSGIGSSLLGQPSNSMVQVSPRLLDLAKITNNYKSIINDDLFNNAFSNSYNSFIEFEISCCTDESLLIELKNLKRDADIITRVTEIAMSTFAYDSSSLDTIGLQFFRVLSKELQKSSTPVSLNLNNLQCWKDLYTAMRSNPELVNETVDAIKSGSLTMTIDSLLPSKCTPSRVKFLIDFFKKILLEKGDDTTSFENYLKQKNNEKVLRTAAAEGLLFLESRPALGALDTSRDTKIFTDAIFEELIEYIKTLQKQFRRDKRCLTNLYNLYSDRYALKSIIKRAFQEFVYDSSLEDSINKQFLNFTWGRITKNAELKRSVDISIQRNWDQLYEATVLKNPKLLARAFKTMKADSWTLILPENIERLSIFNKKVLITFLEKILITEFPISSLFEEFLRRNIS